MKKMKKLIAFLTLFSVVLLGSGITTHAASAELWFSDPTTKVGEEVEVEANIGSSASIQSAEIQLSYDKASLRFISGDSTTGGDGSLTINGSGNQSKLTFKLKFQALKEGETKITVENSQAKDGSGASMQITNGNSTIKIGEGDPSLIKEEEETTNANKGDGPEVVVDGETYLITNEFSDAVLPEGFSRDEMSYEGETCQMIKQDTGSAMAFYLTPVSGGESDFFLFDKENGKFQPFEQVMLSTDRYLILLRDDGKQTLPKNFQETTLTLNGKDFTAWQDVENPEYYVVYGLNTDGNKGLYQYDTVDKTYQRFTPQKVEKKEEKVARTGILGKVLDFVEKHLKFVGIGVGALFLLLLLILLILAVKLRHRNMELDDLYDEYGIDLDEEQTSKKKEATQVIETPVKNKKSGPSVRKPVKADLKEDDFVILEEEGLEELKSTEEDFVTEDYSDFFSYEEEEEDDLIEDLDDLLSSQPKKKRGHMEEDDTFKVDFVDLD